MRYIHHMHQQVCLTHLIEGRLKRLHQIGGQLADETDSVSQQERQVVNDHLTDSSIEGGKEFVLCKDITLGEQVHHRRLTHIGIAHQCHTNQSATILTLRCLLLVNLQQTFFQQRDTLADDTLVHLQLCLTRTTQTYTTLSATTARATALTFQVGPQTLQTGQHITILRQLYLCLCLCRLGTHGKDIKNQRGAVENLHLQFRLDITHLLG